MAEVLITGCSTGFGLLSALEFGRSGDHVFAGVRDLTSAGHLRSGADDEGLLIDVVRVDVDDPASVEACVAGVIEASGRIDVLINNAGIAAFAAVEDTSEELARAMIETNVLGPLRVIRAVLPHMRQQGNGRIINVSSINGVTGFPFGGVYSATKFAIEALSEALATEVGPLGIGVTIVQPGAFHTAIDNKLLDVAPSTVFPGVATMIATMRNASASDDPGEVARAIVSAARADVSPMRVQVGADCERVYQARRSMDDHTFAAKLLSVLSGA